MQGIRIPSDNQGWMNPSGVARIKWNGGRSPRNNWARGEEMPLFEYQCHNCGKAFEVLTQRRDRTVTPECPTCGKTGVERIWSPFSGRIIEGGSCTCSQSGLG